MAAGAVVYAKNVEAIDAFYGGVAGLRTTHAESGYHVLESDAFQLVVVAMRPHIAATVRITSPPKRREDTAIKLVLPVASIDTARAMAVELGGQVDPPEREWEFQGSRTCDGHDPEGNVFQLRQCG
jgi:predicted enzyme related to lactoylglutathione lyase